MKKYFAIVVIFLTASLSAQKLSTQFDIKAYANEQTQMIKSALDLDQDTADKVYKANLSKAYSIHKYIILHENLDKVQGKTLSQVIKEVKKDAERGAGYQSAMKGILGEQKYLQYLEKFESK
jgi:hypothetical protein